jgi:dTDP-4-dehydrorhamnose reductase
MKVLIIGANGQLGTDLCKTLSNFEVIPLLHRDIEVTDINSVFAACQQHRPDVIINTASYVRVDDCEDNIEHAYRVNALGARNVAVAAQEVDATLVHISTDYVFGGDEKHTIPYTEFDVPAPLNIYGGSKLASEKFIQHLCHRYFIVRTSSLFGMAGCSGKGGNFIETILKLAKQQDELRVVNDQVFSPTYSKDLAEKITQLISTKHYGIYHITNSGSCSWYEFALETLNLAGSKTPIIPVTSSGYPQRARRPSYSVLDNYHLRLLGIDNMRHWKEALRDYLKEKNGEEINERRNQS